MTMIYQVRLLNQNKLNNKKGKDYNKQRKDSK